MKDFIGAMLFPWVFNDEDRFQISANIRTGRRRNMFADPDAGDCYTIAKFSVGLDVTDELNKSLDRDR